MNTPMTSIKPTLDNVIEYWNKNPVHSVEFSLGTDLKVYFDTIDQLRWSDNERWAEPTFYNFPGDDRKRLLDAGCGIGVFSRYYARKQFQVYAVDISSKAVELTKRSFEMYGLKGNIQVGNVEALPYENNYFDYLVSNGVIHHTPHSEQAVSEFYRVLKPGGLASVCVYYKNILLRPPIWNLVRSMLPIFVKEKNGREAVFSVKSPEDLAGVYDGNGTPIAKLYTKAQCNKMFKDFICLAAEPHYFPARFLRFVKSGGFIHRMLDRYVGVLIYYLLRKPL